MWFVERSTTPDWRPAEKHLRRVDPVLAAIIGRVGPCTLSPRRDYFVALCQSIFSQQLSTAVAAALFSRFRRLFPSGRPTPGAVVEVLTGDPAVWRTCGLSRQKHAYMLDLARRFADGRIPTRRFAKMSDEEIIEVLSDVRGIGRWTAEMFLIFVMNREDVLPVDDLGLRKGVQRAYGMRNLPTATSLIRRGEIWRPFRTVATWYLWRGL